MFRWTSAVPPPMVSAGANRKPRDQVGSDGAQPLTGPVPVSMPRGPARSRATIHDVLAVGVGDRLADRGLGPRRPARQDGRDHPQAKHPEDLGLDPDVDEPVTGGRVGRTAGAPDQIHEILGRRAHPPQRPLARERDTLVAERDLGQLPSSVLGPDEMVGRDAHVGQEHLVEGVLTRHVDQRPDVDPGRIHGADEVADPHVLGGRGIGAGEQDPPPGDVRIARPHLLPVDHPVVAVALGPRRERGQVGAGAGLGEQLAPELLPAEQRPEPAVLLLLGAGVHEGRPRPSDADGVDRAPHPGPPQLLVDHQLGQRIGVEPVRRGPVGRHVAGLGQLSARRVAVPVEPFPHPAATGVVVTWEAEVHARGA